MNVRFYLGCAAYRTLDPVTADSRERVRDACVTVPGEDHEALLSRYTAAEHRAVYSGMGHEMGYGGVRNLERLTQRAIQSQADVLVYHDSDMKFEPDDVGSLVARWAEFGPGAIVGSVYPDATNRERLVGALAGVPNEFGVFTKRAELQKFLDAPQEDAPALEADFLGLGLSCVPLHWFKGRPAPWWRESWDGSVHLGPDVWIASQFRANGMSVVADLRSRPCHLSREWLRA